MVYIGIIICFIMIFIGIIMESKKINPITMFYTLWLIILTLSSLKLFNLRETSNKIYYIITIGLITYAIGFYLISIFSRKYTLTFKVTKYIRNKNIKIDYILRYKVMYMLGIIIILFYTFDLLKILPYILSGSNLGDIRKLAQDSNSVLYSNKSAIENAIRILIVTPGAMVFQPIVAIEFFNGRRDKKLLILDFIIIMLRVITDGSRSLIVYLLLNSVVVYTLVGQKKLEQKTKLIKGKIGKKRKISIILMLIVGIIFLYKATLSRSGENAVRFLYYYFSMEPYMFNIWADIIDSSKIIGYGVASTNGFWFLIFYIIINILRLPTYPNHWNTINNLILSTDSQWQVIAGRATGANAYVSLFWFFYLDGRVFGVAIGMFIYGMVVSLIFNKALKKKNSKIICLYSIIMQGLCFSFVRMQFANIYYTIAVLFIIMIAYKSKKTKHNTIS